MVGEIGDQCVDQQGQQVSCQGYLVGSDVVLVEVLYVGMKKILKVWFELIDGNYVSQFLC